MLRPGGKSLISVWAFEQELNRQKSNYLKESRIKQKHLHQTEDSKQSSCDALMRKNLSSSCSEESYKSLDVHVNRTPFEKQDLLVPWQKKDKCSDLNTSRENCVSGDCSVGEKKPKIVYHRFYHVFKEGELNELVQFISDARIIETYYDNGNWCVILEKTTAC